MTRKFDSILGTVGNTPIVRINKLAPPGVHLFVKIEAFNPLGSVKDRLALGVIEDAERRGALKPGQTVIEATSGNTGIGLAMVCAQKGYPLVVTMAESFSVERRKLMRFLGAKVVITPAAERGIGMVKKAVELAETHGWFLTRQFENEANADMHSRTTAREIVNAFAGEPLDYWVTGFGTGGTLKGVGRVLEKERPETKVVVCEPADAPMLSSGTTQQQSPDGDSRSEPSLVEAASNPGLESRLHSEARRRRGQDGLDRSRRHGHGARGDALQPRAREAGGDSGGNLVGRNIRGRAPGVQGCGERRDDPLHAARYG